MATYRLVNLMMVPLNLYGDWADWNDEHARDMVKAGFISGQTWWVRPDYTRNHPEALPTRPPYNMVQMYEVDEQMLQTMLVKKTPEMGRGPAGGTRPFPSPLGKNMGDGFLLEPIYEAFRREPADGNEPVCRLMVMMEVPEELYDDWAEWNREHARDMVAAGFNSGQTFKVRKDFSYIHPETLPDRPPYNMVQIYEVGEQVVNAMLINKKPAMGEGPAGGTRPFPSPLGKHMGDGYLVSPLFDEHRRET